MNFKYNVKTYYVKMGTLVFVSTNKGSFFCDYLKDDCTFDDSDFIDLEEDDNKMYFVFKTINGKVSIQSNNIKVL